MPSLVLYHLRKYFLSGISFTTGVIGLLYVGVVILGCFGGGVCEVFTVFVFSRERVERVLLAM